MRSGTNPMTRFERSLGKSDPSAETLTGVKVSINRLLMSDLELMSPVAAEDGAPVSNDCPFNGRLSK
jgi:hypothetical protein